jgi:hypothetical protein
MRLSASQQQCCKEKEIATAACSDQHAELALRWAGAFSSIAKRGEQEIERQRSSIAIKSGSSETRDNRILSRDDLPLPLAL